MEEAEVIEEASRRTGKTPSQFVKEAGIASALAVLDVGRAGKDTMCIQSTQETLY
jgi:uncharacterized protein (DUF1778 family)